MVEKLGINQTYKDYVKGNCKDNPAATRFAQHLLLESENVRIIDGGMLLHEPVLYKKLDDQFHNVHHKTFGVGADAEHLVSYRLTKDHVTFHSTMYPRRGNSCSYLIECHSHGRVVFGKVVCYISCENIAYALLLKYNIGLNVCQGLPLPQDVVLWEIVRRTFLGQDFMEVQETNIPMIVNCNAIVNRCLEVEGHKDRKIFMTVLDTPYEDD